MEGLMPLHALIAAGPGGPKTVLDLSPSFARALYDRLDRMGLDASVYRPDPGGGWVELLGTMPPRAHADLLPFNPGDRDHDRHAHAA
jgi:hypothetical protein